MRGTATQTPKCRRRRGRQFHTPPRGGRTGASGTGLVTGTQVTNDNDYDPTLLRESAPLPPDKVVIDEEILEPPLPFSVPTDKSVSHRTERTHSWAYGRKRRDNRLGRGGSKSAGAEEGDLQAISTSSLTLSRLFDSLNTKIIDNVRDLLRSQLVEVRDMQDKLSATVSSELRDMRGTVDIVVSHMKGTGFGKSGPKTSLTAWEDKLNAMTPKADVVFSTNVFARIVCFNGPLKAVDAFNRVDDTDSKKAAVALQTLLFSLQPGEKKHLYSTGVGKLHSEFKYGVVQKAFFNVCNNNFKLFTADLTLESQETCSLGPESSTMSRGYSVVDGHRIKRPEWLKAGYVTKDHLNAARKFLETLNQSRKARIRTTPSPDDIATHGAVRVYRLLRSHLHQSRDNVRAAFFEGVGYLFTNWSKYVKDTDQSTMVVRFLHSDEEEGLNLGEIPHTTLCPSTSDASRINLVDAENKKKLKELFSTWPSMIILAEHEVHVVNGGGVQRKHTGGEKRTIRKLINLIEVACNVVVEYTRVGSPEMFFRSHKAALQCVMIFAYLFKSFCADFMEWRRLNHRSFPELADLVVHDVCAKELLPGDNTQSGFLKSRCLRMQEKEFEALHRCEEEDNCASREDEEGVFEANQIQESADVGVAFI